MLKTIALVVALFLGVGLFGGCSSDAQPTATKTVTVAPTPKPTKNDLFLKVVRHKYPRLLSNTSNANLIRLAHSVCSAFDAGASWNDIVSMAMSSTSNVRVATALGYVVGAGVATYCPQYTGQIANPSDAL